MAQTYPKLLNLLQSTKIKDLPSLKDQFLVEFGPEDLIRDVHETLVGKKILSAPVLDIEQNKYLGMIDLRDIVALALSLHKNQGPFVLTADKIVDFSKMNPFHPVSADATVMEAMEEMATKGLHRVPLMEKDRVWRILSQSDIVHWLATCIAQKVEAVQEIAGLTFKQIESQLGGVSGLKYLLVTVSETEPLQKAFELMQTYNIHGIPVLSKEGKLVGNISVSDMKYAVKWDLSNALNHSCAEFLKEAFPEHLTLVKCDLSTTLGEVITQLATTQVHRSYVVDKDLKPVDIITLSNVLEAICTLASPDVSL